jgi:hypothetical protein
LRSDIMCAVFFVRRKEPSDASRCDRQAPKPRCAFPAVDHVLGIGESHQLGVLQRFRLRDRTQLLMVSRWRLSIATMAPLQVLHRSKPQKSASATHRGRFEPRERHCSSTRDERAARARHSQCAVRAPSVAAIRFSAPLDVAALAVSGISV